MREGQIISKFVFAKKLAVYALNVGRTVNQEIEPDLQNQQTLLDEQILELERIGLTKASS